MKPQEGESQPLLAGERLSHGEGTWRVLAACIGFLADSYDLFTIDLVVLILQLEYGELLVSARAKAMMVSAMLAGVVIGQLAFGYVADWLGRKWAFVTTAALTILGALSCSLCSGPATLPIQMSVCRFFLGLGVGGEYPLSATVTAEALSDSGGRGQAMAVVVSMQGLGMLMSAMMAMLMLSMPLSLEAIWRLLLGFGAVPSALAFCMRWSLTESDIFEKSKQKVEDSPRRKILEAISARWPLLAGTASTWLLMNMFAYSLGSFKSTIFDAVIHTSSLPPTEEVFQHARFAAITSCFAIVGFGAGLCLVRITSRFKMQLYGFLAIAVVFFTVAGLMSMSDRPSVLSHVAALGFMFLFLNSGPNLTTYIVPAEIFPTCARASCHGISAACGKLGAFFGTAAFPLLQQSCGMEFVYGACGILSLAAALITFSLTPREVCNLEQLDASEKCV